MMRMAVFQGSIYGERKEVIIVLVLVTGTCVLFFCSGVDGNSSGKNEFVSESKVFPYYEYALVWFVSL